MNDAWLDQESIIIHTCSCRKRLTATEGESLAVCSTVTQYSFSLFGNTRLTLSHHAPVPALDNAACSPLSGPPLMTVISVLDDEGCFANKNIYVFVVSLHIITICHLLTLGTDVLLVTVRSWHWPHVRLLLIPGSSASLGNHQLLYVWPAGRGHWLTEHLLGRHLMTL